MSSERMIWRNGTRSPEVDKIGRVQICCTYLEIDSDVVFDILTANLADDTPGEQETSVKQIKEK